MRLTNMDRDAFVSAAMDDVPCVDYQQKMRKAAMEYAIERMPKDVKAAYKTNPEWVTNCYVHASGCPSMNLPCMENGRHILERELEQHLSDDIKASRAQDKVRSDLRQKLKGAIYGCSTLKQAYELLPEFKKYLPQDRDGKIVRTMPVVANLVTDLMAAGWPKAKAA